MFWMLFKWVLDMTLSPQEIIEVKVSDSMLKSATQILSFTLSEDMILLFEKFMVFLFFLCSISCLDFPHLVFFSSWSIQSCTEFSCIFVIMARFMFFGKSELLKGAMPIFVLLCHNHKCIISEPQVRKVVDFEKGHDISKIHKCWCWRQRCNR